MIVGLKGEACIRMCSLLRSDMCGDHFATLATLFGNFCARVRVFTFTIFSPTDLVPFVFSCLTLCVCVCVRVSTHLCLHSLEPGACVMISPGSLSLA